MVLSPFGRGEGRPEEATVTPLLARIVNREQDLESAIERAREQGRLREAAARSEADRLVDESRRWAEEEAKALVHRVEGEARAEAERLGREAALESAEILKRSAEADPALIGRLMKIVLPHGKAGDAP